jgi:Co/Zn/Cd efflux system component
MNHNAIRRAVAWAAILNGTYFGVEFTVGLSIRSVSLIADSIDFLEDASINLLILIGLGLAVAARARLGSLLAVIIAVPGVAAFVAAVDKFLHPAIPGAIELSATAFGALVVNATAAVILSRVKHHEHSLVQAAWLSARNDVFANVAIIAAAGMTALIPSAYWDVAVGLGIGVLNADAAVKVWRRARTEAKTPQA